MDVDELIWINLWSKTKCDILHLIDMHALICISTEKRKLSFRERIPFGWNIVSTQRKNQRTGNTPAICSPVQSTLRLTTLRGHIAGRIDLAAMHASCMSPPAWPGSIHRDAFSLL